MPVIKQHLSQDGVVLLSGLLSDDETAILERAAQFNLQKITLQEKK